jgi:branched-chain amino acid transport system ATP-binding protein
MADVLLLKVSGLKVAYGGIQAVKGVSFEVREGELVSLIGANGAGKTTTLKAVTGLQPVKEGEIRVPGPVHQGAGRLEPGQAGAGDGARGSRHLHAHDHHREPADGRLRAQGRRRDRADIDKVFAIFPRLKERKPQLAGTMSGGEQQMLAMGRALMARPKVLLLDEPSMGLSPIMVDKIFEVVHDIHGKGVTVLLVEQNASRALALANRGYVMESGAVTMSGPGHQLLADPKVRAAYLGE